MSDCMSREEAIQHLEEMKKGIFLWDMSELIDLCISALSENKGDLISRGEVESVLHNNLHALIDTDQLYQLYKDIGRLHAYSFPDSAENKGEITALEAENKTLRIKLENAEDVLRGLKEDLADARAELRERW